MRAGSSLRRTGLVLLGLVVAAGCGQPAAPAEPMAPANPLAGAWSVAAIENADGTAINPAQAGLFVFTASHYSAVYTNTAEPRPAAATHFEPTDEEALAQYASIIVNTGTYAVDGATITFRPLIARSPAFIGGEAIATFDIAGDTLTLRYQSITSFSGVGVAEVGGSMTLRRAE